MPSEDHELLEPDEKPWDVRDLLVALMPYRWFVLAASVAAGLVALWIATSRPIVYEAVTHLLASPSKFGDMPEASISMETYRLLLDSQSLRSAVVKDFHLDEDPTNLTSQQLGRCCLDIRVMEGSTVFEVAVRLGDAQLAAEVANRVADRAVATARGLNQDEILSARDFIEVELDENRARLAAANDELETFGKNARLELLRSDVRRLTEQRQTLADLLIQIEVEKARLAATAQELASQERVRDVPSIVATTDQGGENVDLRPEVVSPYINPVYEALSQQLAMSRTRLAALETQKAELSAELPAGSAVGKLDELRLKEARLAHLQLERDLAQQAYEETAARYEEARLQVSGRNAQLQVLDAALVPDVPLPRRIVQTTTFGLAVGFLLAVAAVLVYAQLRRPVA